MDRVADPVALSAPPLTFGRTVWAIARMQLRAWLNVMRRGLRSDPLPTALGVFFQLTGAMSSLGLMLGMFFLTALGIDGETGPFWVVTAAVFGMTFMGALSGVSGDGGDIAEASRLVLYPLPRKRLVALDLMSELLSPTILFFSPAMLGMAAGGVVWNATHGRWAAAVVAPVAAVLAIVASSALIRVVIGWVSLGGRRLREALGILLTSVILMFAFSGTFVQEAQEHDLSHAAGLVRRWLVVTHAGAVGAAIDHGSIAGLVSMIAWSALALWLHRRVTTRILDGESGTIVRARRHAHAVATRPWLLERVLSAPVFGVAAVDVRTTMRMPTMWILLLLPAMFGLILGRPATMGNDPSAGASALALSWIPSIAALGAHFLFSWQLFCNVFGTDHGGVAQYVLSPVRGWQLLLGKALSRALFGSAQVVIFLSVLGLRLGVTREQALLAYASWLAAATWVSAAGGLISIRMPFRISHGLKRERNLRGLTGLVGQAAIAFVLIPPSAMMLGGRALAGTGGYVAGILVSFAVGLVLWLLTALLAETLLERRAPELVADLTQGL